MWSLVFLQHYTYRKAALSFVPALWIVVGCVAIPNETTLIVESTPSGANVVSSEGWECSTPCTRSVSRDSRFDVKLVHQGYESVEKSIEIPELKPSRVGTYIGTGVGVFAGIGSIEIGEALGTALLQAFFGELSEPLELSTSEKLRIMAQAVLIYGGIGYAVDRIRDSTRAKRPYRVEVLMAQKHVYGDQTKLAPKR